MLARNHWILKRHAPQGLVGVAIVALGHAFIIRQPNTPSGGRLSHIELGEFLRKEDGPEQQALLRLIGMLVEVLTLA